MNRILISFVIAASLFAVSAANAQEQDKVPSSMLRTWKPTPSVATEVEKGAQPQPEYGARTLQLQKENTQVAPEQPVYSEPPVTESPGNAVHPELHRMGAAKEAQAIEEAALPKGDFTELRQMDTAGVDQVIDPLRIRLKNRRIIQLAGIEIPDLDPYEPGDVSKAARDYLENLLTNKQVRLYQTKDPKKGRTNRMDYVLGHLVISGSEAWVQGALISAGLARVLPSARNPEMAAQMIRLEDEARKAGHGLWADPRYAILTPDTAKTGLNNWAVVQGRVHSAAMAGNKLYLNFGPDWRTDFTITLNPDTRRELGKQGIDPLNLGGKMVRARGWLEDYNGPSLELSHATWLEILQPPQPDSNLPD